MTLTGAWLAGLLAAPWVTVLLCLFDKRTDRVRVFAIACAAVSCGLGCLVYLVPAFESHRVPWPWQSSVVLGSYALQVTAVSRPLIALPAALWLVTVAATPTTISGSPHMKITVNFPFTLLIPFTGLSNITLSVDTLAPVISPLK